MTLKEFLNVMTADEQEKFENAMYNWLGRYTEEVVNHVLGKMDAIVNDGTALSMIYELSNGTEIEEKMNRSSISSALRGFGEYINHYDHWDAAAYRTVLYNMFIKDMHKKER